MSKKKDLVYQEVSELCVNSLKDSNKKIYLEKILKYCTESTAPSYIWEQNGIPLLLLQEIIEPYLTLTSLTKEMSDNLVVVLKILQYLVKDDKIKKIIVDGQFHYYLFRYVTIYDTGVLYERPRLCVLKIFSEIVTNQYVQNNIKNTEIVPIIFKNIDLGSIEVKCLSMQIFYNLISGDEGLNYVTQTFYRFSAINQVYNSICRVVSKNKEFSVIKWVLKIYIRLCSKTHIRQALIAKNPNNVINEEMKKLVSENEECAELYKHLLYIINKVNN